MPLHYLDLRNLTLDDRRSKTGELYLRGLTQVDIARMLNICQQTVSNDIAACRKEWLAHRLLQMDEIIAVQLAKIDRAEAAAWDGYDRSCEQARSKRTKEDSRGAEVTRTVEGRDGNPRFLELALRCVRERCELLGVYAARDADARDASAPEIGDMMTVEQFRGLSVSEQQRVMQEAYRRWDGKRRPKLVDGRVGDAGAESGPAGN